jgi:hypothetical protein
MKYEFIRLDEDNIKLKYKDKEFTFKVNVKLISEMQQIIMKSRIKMIQDFAKNGLSIKDLTIEIKKDGKTYYDNSNKLELEKIYQEQEYLSFFNEKCQEIFDMDLQTLIDDIGLTEEETEKFGKDLMNYLSGKTPLPKHSKE